MPNKSDPDGGKPVGTGQHNMPKATSQAEGTNSKTHLYLATYRTLEEMVLSLGMLKLEVKSPCLVI